MATELATELDVGQVYLMPCFEAVHKKEVGASAGHRLNMLNLSLSGRGSLSVDIREIERGKPSYTIDSLKDIRKEVGDESLCIVMGTDSAKSLSFWKGVAEFATLTNIIVIRRSTDEPLEINSITCDDSLLALGFHQAESITDLKQSCAGKFFRLDLSELDISSTAIRESVQQKKSVRYLVTDAVNEYICDNTLYCH